MAQQAATTRRAVKAVHASLHTAHTVLLRSTCGTTDRDHTQSGKGSACITAHCTHSAVEAAHVAQQAEKVSKQAARGTAQGSTCSTAHSTHVAIEAAHAIQ